MKHREAKLLVYAGTFLSAGEYDIAEKDLEMLYRRGKLRKVS